MTDHSAPAGAQERMVGDFTVRTYIGERDRIEVIGNHSGAYAEAPVIQRKTIGFVIALLRCLHKLDAFKDPKSALTVPAAQDREPFLREYERRKLAYTEAMLDRINVCRCGECDYCAMFPGAYAEAVAKEEAAERALDALVMSGRLTAPAGARQGEDRESRGSADWLPGEADATRLDDASAGEAGG